MKKHFTKAAIVAALAGVVGLASVTEADARRGRRVAGIVLGTAIGLGIASAYAHSRPRYYGYRSYCYEGEPRCRWVDNCWHDRYGRYRCETVKRCYRPTYCD